MPFGLIPARGPWETRRFNQASAATFSKGDLLTLDGPRNVVLYASTASTYLGIALGDSSASLPRGKVSVAIPAPGCTAMADVATGQAASAYSIGQSVHIFKSDATRTSFASTWMQSNFSRNAVIVGEMDSAQSRIEIAFVSNGALYSHSTSTYLS